MAVISLLRAQPALALFLVLGVGYVVGRLRIGGVQLGTSTGVLLGGLLLGHWGVQGSSGSQSIGFMLFIYCVGVRAGPQFFSAFREQGLRFGALAVVVALLGGAAAVVVGGWLGLPAGFSAGLLAGALTSTPTLVAAQDAVRNGVADLPAGLTADAALQNIAASYAITYVVGMFGLLVVVSTLPRVLGIDLKAEARRLGSRRAEGEGARRAFAPADLPALRVYRVMHAHLIGRALGPLPLFAETGCLLQAVKRGGRAIAVTPELALQHGDLVAVLGRRVDQRRAQEQLGDEGVDDELLDVAVQTRAILVTASAVSRGAATAATVLEAGCFLAGWRRAGLDLPLGADASFEKGDIVVAAGLPRAVDALAVRLGRSAPAESETDLVTFSFGIAAGLALGLITVYVGGIPIGLGTAGGLLLSGLVMGFLHTLNPTLGQMPLGATTVLMELGLQFFMANIGLEAGGSILEALRTTGPWLPLGALVVMSTPVLVGFAVGRLVLGFDAVILLGALTGSMTSTPALDLVNRQADSSLPTIGYAGTYGFANVLLAIAGSLLMRW